MLENQNTADLVRKELENDLYLLEILKEGLVNYSALAKKLLPNIKKANSKATVESISIAIKRFVLRENEKDLSLISKRIIANSQLSTKNDVVHKTFKRNELILNKIVEVSRKVEWDKDEIFFINQGFGEVTIILDEKNKDCLDECNNILIEERTDLAILSIKEIFKEEVEKSINVVGVYSYFLNQLARKSINVVEIISTFSQLTLVLKNEDLMRAYLVVEEIIRYFRNKNLN